MDRHLLGGTMALLTALTWAFAMILYKRGGERVPPLALNLFKNLQGLILLAPTLWLLDGGLQAFEAYSADDVAILVLSGFLGIAVADTLFFYSLNLVGVGVVSIIDCLYMPFILLFSWWILVERLTAVQYAGAALVLAAVAITVGQEPPRSRSRRRLLAGIALGVLDMAVMTFGIVIAKPVIERTPLIASTAIRVGAGALSLLILIAVLPQRRTLLASLRPSRDWMFIVPGSFLGAYLALILWMGGFQNTWASVAGTLNQTSSIFALVLASVFLKEPFTRRKALSVTLAMAGVALVMGPAILAEVGR